MYKTILTLLIVSFSFLSFSQIDNDQKLNVPLDKEVVYGKLPNGMTYYIRHNELPKERAEYYIVHNVGAILENEDQNGLAHFTEHLAFNGTKNFPKKGILNFMELNGVAFGHNVNAYTGQEETVYMIQKVPTTRTGLIDTSLMILHDWSSFILMEDEEIDAERGVIHEEWRTRRNADFRLMKKTMPVIYNGSKYVERDVIGDIDVIDNHKYQTIRNFYHDWYRPDLQALIIVGDIDPVDIEKRIKRIFADIPKRENPKERYQVEIPNNDEPLIDIATDPEATSLIVRIMYKHDVVKAEDKDLKYLKKQTVSTLYQMMLNNRLNELTQQEKPPFIFAMNMYGALVRSKSVYQSFGLAKPGEIDHAIEALLIQNKRVKEHGFTMSELDRAKSDLKVKLEKQYKERNKTQSGAFINKYMNHFLKNEPTPGIEFEYKFNNKILPAISLKDVNALADERITDNNMVITVIGPGKEDSELFTEEKVKEIIEKVKTMKVDAYEEEVSDEPLIKNVPKAAKILSEKTEKGVTEIKYSNGVTVVIKPTDFKDDEILMNAFSLGGYSLVKTEDLPSAMMTGSIIPMSGVADFSNIELQKKLAGKNVRVSPYIAKNYEGFRGNCTPKDFETMMQLTYLYFTNPRKDKVSYSAYMQRIGGFIENQSLNPNARFNDTITVTMADNNPRVMPFNKDLISKVDYDKLYEIYNDRFKDANDFVFVLVGNVDVDKVKPFIDAYLGGLPSSQREETFKDNNISAPEGKIVKELKEKLEVEKSTVYVNFNGDYKYTAENNMELSALQYILKLRYTETIREEEGGSYGVGVRASKNHYPVETYQIYIKFDCAPEKSKHLTSIVYREIDKIIENGPSDVDLQKTKEYFKKTREEQIKENNFWLTSLFRKYYHGYDPSDAEKFDELIDKMTIKSLKKAAKEYFKNNSVQIVLMPE